MYKKSYNQRDKFEETNNVLKEKNNNISALEHKNGMLQKELNISNQEVEEMNRRIN